MLVRGPRIALPTILCFVALFGYSLFQLIVIDRNVRQEIGESNLWAVTQADREAQNLLLTLSRVDEDSTANDVLLRMDILYSRVTLLSTRPQIDYFRAIGIDKQIGKAQKLLTEIDTILSPSTLSATQMREASPKVAEITAVLREVSNATELEEQADRQQRRQTQIKVMNLLLLAVAGIFVTGLAMAALLWRNMRRAMRTQEALRQHRAELENIVATRTLELRNALEVERRAKDVYHSFIVTVSHQFRTPVSIIHMIAQRQARGDDPTVPDLLRRKFLRILDASERLERLLNGFLSSSSIDGRNISMSRRVVDLNALVDIAVSQTRDLYPNRTITVSLGSDDMRLEADSILLEQVFLNLLSNALKYSDAPEIVEMNTYRDGNRLFCKVLDHGAGIPDDAQAAVFDKFYRASNVHRLPGVGVGLSLVRDIVSLHGSEVTFTSRVGVGSEFIVALPALGDTTNEAGTCTSHDLMR